MRILSRNETLLLCACVSLLAIALLGPALAQSAHYHAFADQRVLLGIPFAMDVLSNLPFAVMGLVGAWCLWRLPAAAISLVQRAMAALFFGGLVVTATCSSWYHLHPDDAGLLIDRCGMAVAFAGLLGLAAAVRISERAGAALGLVVLGLAPASVSVWSVSGNILPWAALQFGGMALVLWFACLPQRRAALAISWGLVILAYVLAKLIELQDHAVFEITGGLVSGHTFKHVLAALAAWPVIMALRSLFHGGQMSAGGATSNANACRFERQA